MASSGRDKTIVDTDQDITLRAGIIDSYQDTALRSVQNLETAEVRSNGNITIFKTTSNVYVTAVSQPVIQQFITNDVNSPGGSNLEIQFNDSGNLTGDPNLTFDPVSKTLNVTGIASFGPPNLIRIPGGSNNYVLTTDGTGNLRWGPSTGGSSLPGGPNSSIQFNVNGAFTGSDSFTYDSINNLVLADNLASDTVKSNKVSLGDTTNVYSTQQWITASTNSTSPDQVLFSLLSANSSSMDFHVTATDGTAARQVTKLLSVNIGSSTNYSEYGGMNLNSQIASYSISQTAGIIKLTATPLTANAVQYSIILTIYN